MNDVAIIGVGLHPFGRFGAKSAIEMAADAIQLALEDSGVAWKDIQFGIGGSYEVDNTDAVTRLVGLTGIPFTNVFNACATSASAIEQTADGIRSGKYDIGIAVGTDKHPRGAFTADPAMLGLPAWYAENGQFVTTKFFGMKANRYAIDHDISHETLARVAAKNYRNGGKNPKAFRRTEFSIDEILSSPMLNYPLTAKMFCAPDEGAAAVIMCRGDSRRSSRRTSPYTCGRRRSAPAHTAPTRCTLRGRQSRRTSLPPCTQRRPRTRLRESAPRTSTSHSCRTPTPAQRSSTWPRPGCVPMATRRS